MNKKETAELLAILTAGYPKYYKDMNETELQGVVSLWSMQFKDVPAEIVFMALNKAISTSKYPPTIAEVKEKFSSVHWEAYEMINRHYNTKALTDKELAFYKRICELTKAYKFNKRAEPSIGNMLTGNNVKQLGERRDG